MEKRIQIETKDDIRQNDIAWGCLEDYIKGCQADEDALIEEEIEQEYRQNLYEFYSIEYKKEGIV